MKYTSITSLSCIMMLKQWIKICCPLYFWCLPCTAFRCSSYLKYRYVYIILVSSCCLNCSVMQFLQVLWNFIVRSWLGVLYSYSLFVFLVGQLHCWEVSCCYILQRLFYVFTIRFSLMFRVYPPLPQIQHVLTLDRTRAAAVGSRRLRVFARVQPWHSPQRFHLFRPMKMHIGGQKFTTDELNAMSWTG
jgi:hypothetical protein